MELRTLGAVFLLGLMSWSSVWAEETVSGNAAYTEKKLPTIELGMAFGGQTLNHYRGSKGTQTKAYPFPFLIYRGDFLKIVES